MYKYVINAQNIYLVSNKGLLEDSEKGENVVETVGCYCFLFEKQIVKRFVQCHIFAQLPLGWRSEEEYSCKLCALPYLRNNVSFEVLFGSNGN